MNAACAQRAAIGTLDVFPEKRRYFIAHKAIENAAGLLSIHTRHINITWLRDSLQNGVLGNFIVCDAPKRLAASYRSKNFLQMPCNGFSLAVRIARQIDFVRLLNGILQIGNDLLLIFGNRICRNEIPCILACGGNGDSIIFGRKFANMTNRTLDGKFAAKVFGDSLRLCRRFHNQKFFGHD